MNLLNKRETQLKSYLRALYVKMCVMILYILYSRICGTTHSVYFVILWMQPKFIQ